MGGNISVIMGKSGGKYVRKELVCYLLANASASFSPLATPCVRETNFD